MEQEFVIGGYTPGARGFDALLVGVYKKKELIFVAKVKDGFVPRIRDEIFPALKKLRVVHCPFQKPARDEGIAVGRVANRGENESMPLGQTEAGLPGRFRRMDRCRALAALHLRRHAR
jgi:ATP-dependent DNA ligase